MKGQTSRHRTKRQGKKGRQLGLANEPGDISGTTRTNVNEMIEE